MNIQQFINQKGREGVHFFTLEEAVKNLDKSQLVTRSSLTRLIKEDQIALPYRGFYLIIPPQYQPYRCLPANQFIPDLMHYLQIPYYTGLLSAAEYYGAAHHKPQRFQVMLPKRMHPINCGKIYITFYNNDKTSITPVRQFNTPTGYISVSTPEATALDLICYPRHSGGLDNIATVLSELVETMKPEALLECIQQIKPDMVDLQRLGYIFDFLELENFSSSIEPLIKNTKPRTRPFAAWLSTRGTPRNKKWALYINHELDPDI